MATTLCFGAVAAGDVIIFVDASAAEGGDGTSWTQAYADLHDALADAAELPCCVQVWVAAGEYRPGALEDGPEMTFKLVNGIEIYGGFAGGEQSLGDRDWKKNETILSGGSMAYHVLTGENMVDGVVLDGLIIERGDAREYGSADSGGGLRLTDSTLLIANCLFTENWALYGGALFSSDSDLTIVNSRFTSNRATDDAGGLAIVGGTLSITGCEFIGEYAIYTGSAIRAENATVVIEDSLFHDNRTSGIGWIGVIRLDDSHASIFGSVFTENYAYGNGGIGSFGGSLTVHDCTFTDNWYESIYGHGDLEIIATTMSNNGGGVVWGGPATIIGSTFFANGCGWSECAHGGASLGGGKIEIRDSVFHGNGSNFSFGGNLELFSGDVTMRNCRITHGVGAMNYGTGGLYVSGQGSLTAVNCLIAGNIMGIRIRNGFQTSFINCTIIDNLGFGASGVGLAVEDNSHAVVRNTVLWGNLDAWAEVGDDKEIQQIIGSAKVEHSIVEGLKDYAGFGNLGDDPVFADADGRLAAASPAIDAGDNQFVPSDVETDLDGNQRFVDATGDTFATVDMGAFEFPTRIGDLNGDGMVDASDVLILLGAWGQCESDNCPADINGDGTVDVLDLLIVLDNWD